MKQSSLTSPSDMSETTHIPVEHPPLSNSEMQLAYSELSVDNTSLYNKIERKYADPSLPGQVYCLHSFVPSKGATADEDGIYGMIKIRGTFSSLQETNERAEALIRNHDSYHKIYHGWVGKPMPLTIKSEWSAEVEEVDVSKKVTKIIKDNIKEKRTEEKQQVAEIRERERNLKQSVEQESSDPYEKYTCLRVKKAQIIWGYLEHRKKMEEMDEVFRKTLEEIGEMDSEDSDYAVRYENRYKEARERAGIPEDKNDVSFMKYLNADVNDLKQFAIETDREQELLEDDPNYKVSRVAGSTVTVQRRAQEWDDKKASET